MHAAFFEATTRSTQRTWRSNALAWWRSNCAARGIRDERVLAAMGKVPRERFIAPEYAGRLMPTGPFPLARAKRFRNRSWWRRWWRRWRCSLPTGYWKWEPALATKRPCWENLPPRSGRSSDMRNWRTRRARYLAELGYGNVHVVYGDGSLGLPQHAPFDKILVAAGAPQAPPSLIAQLAEGGRMAVPVGDRVEQQLQIVRKIGGEIVTSSHVLCCFVPLLGAEGWEP